MIELSICIPTYNRGKYLQETVQSIIKQIDDACRDKVEIVISDNCSEDDSFEIISKIKRENPKCTIIFDSAEKNYGADCNYLRVISLARGKYCWFLGSDDLIADDSLGLVLQELKYGHTIFLGDRYRAEKTTMNIVSRQYFFFRELDRDFVFKFRDYKDWDFYLNRCNAIGCLFSYLSSIIFERDKWNEVDACDEYIGTAYVHAAKLLKMLYNDKQSTLKYLSTPLVLNRTGNDSFLTNMYNRTMIDIDGYIKLSNIFGDEKVLQEDIRRVLKRQHPMISWRVIIKVNKQQFEDLCQKLKLIGYDDQELNMMRTLRRHKLICFLLFAFMKLEKSKWR